LLRIVKRIKKVLGGDGITGKELPKDE